MRTKSFANGSATLGLFALAMGGLLNLAPLRAACAQTPAPSPCEVKKAYDKAVADEANAVKELAKTARPLGDNGLPISRQELEQDLIKAKEAHQKAEETKNADERAYNSAKDELKKFDDGADKGTRLKALQKDLNDLAAKITKALDANTKVSQEARRQLLDFKRENIVPLQGSIAGQMPGVPLAEANSQAADKSFTGFSNTEIKGINDAIAQHRRIIDNINALYSNGRGVPSPREGNTIANANEVIATKTAELPAAIERCRETVRNELRSLGANQRQYDTELQKLYPDPETRELVDRLGEFQSEQRTKREQVKPLSEEREKLERSQNEAKDKLEGVTKDGKVVSPGSKKLFKDVADKVTDLENKVKLVKEWGDLAKKSDEATQAVKDKQQDYQNAVKAKDAVVKQAQDALDEAQAFLNQYAQILPAASSYQTRKDGLAKQATAWRQNFAAWRSRKLSTEQPLEAEGRQLAAQRAALVNERDALTQFQKPLKDFLKDKNGVTVSSICQRKDQLRAALTGHRAALDPLVKCFWDAEKAQKDIDGRITTIGAALHDEWYTVGGPSEPAPAEDIEWLGVPSLLELLDCSIQDMKIEEALAKIDEEIVIDEFADTTDELPDDIAKYTTEERIFNVRPGQWLSTGIQLKNGESVGITATGTVKAASEGNREWGPGGFYWVGFAAYTLKGLVGGKLIDIGAGSGFTAPADGELKLGITRTYDKVYPIESEFQGSFKVTVTTTKPRNP